MTITIKIRSQVPKRAVKEITNKTVGVCVPNFRGYVITHTASRVTGPWAAGGWHHR